MKAISSAFLILLLSINANAFAQDAEQGRANHENNPNRS